jgi:hypothetical protein
MGLSIDKMNDQRLEVDDYEEKKESIIKSIEEESVRGEITREQAKDIGIDNTYIDKLLEEGILVPGENGEDDVFTLKKELLKKEPLEEYDEAA